MNLKESLYEYRNLTLELIEKIKNDDELESLFSQRKDIIDNIRNLEFAEDEFKSIYESMGILGLEEKLKNEIQSEQNKIKEKIKYIKITRNARNKYENSQFKPNFFNKKGW